MKNEKILTIIKGQEFKLSLKDKIEINDIFYDQYLEAAAMLENIVAYEERDKQPDWKKAETENGSSEEPTEETEEVFEEEDSQDTNDAE